MFAPRKLIVAACVVALGMSAVTEASGSAPTARPAHGTSKRARRELRVLHRPGERFHRSIESWNQRRSGGGAAASDYQPPEAFGVSSSTLEAIATCESGGDPTAVSADGTYRGKYQFDYGTWASVGGSGDPAAAPEAEQDMRAAMLYARSGSSPWPICG